MYCKNCYMNTGQKIKMKVISRIHLGHGTYRVTYRCPICRKKSTQRERD